PVYKKSIQTHAARGRGSMAMTVKNGIDLLAAFFTLGGDVYPFGPTEISPIRFISLRPIWAAVA
ncbi:hypothetical protein ACC753_37310, partial [Rhizobium ruizarguesonis]